MVKCVTGPWPCKVYRGSEGGLRKSWSYDSTCRLSFVKSGLPLGENPHVIGMRGAEGLWGTTVQSTRSSKPVVVTESPEAGRLKSGCCCLHPCVLLLMVVMYEEVWCCASFTSDSGAHSLQQQRFSCNAKQKSCGVLVLHGC
mmetsp:Transcript_47956/g.74907  ORF Transcript_47956/g.74907 Transcript_47956/m.74907 type:complete len:142 (+) Transcript_47956:97-522(+)